MTTTEIYSWAMTDQITSLKDPIDAVGRQILDILQNDGRTSFSDLGRKVGLSAPAVADRVRRFEELGIISGFAAQIDRARLGLCLTAFIRLKAASSVISDLRILAQETPEILECHLITGDDGFIIKVAAADVDHLDQIIQRFVPFGTTVSSIVLSTTVEQKPITPP